MNTPDKMRPGAQRAGVFEGPERLNYLLFLPESYGQEPAEAWPLILYLHGRGESGSEIATVKRTGLPALLEHRPGFPFVTLSPQCPDGSGWMFHLQTLDEMLDAIIAGYALDERRVYLTGNSMGGNGAWSLAAHHPQRFAALAPICGWAAPELACKLKEIPVWAFHGEADDIIPVEASRVMVEAVRECGGQARLTIYPGVGHDSWTPTYADPALYAWFLQQRRARPGGGETGRPPVRRKDD